MKKIKDVFKLPSYRFEKVFILRKVIDNIIGIAKDTYPKEFSAFLKGTIKKKKLYLTDLVYQPYDATENATFMKINLPLIHETYGTVHSHPGFSNRPSNADLHFFGKRGLVNLIICRPYTEESVQAYDKNGDEISFTIIDRFIN